VVDDRCRAEFGGAAINAQYRLGSDDLRRELKGDVHEEFPLALVVPLRNQLCTLRSAVLQKLRAVIVAA
jgi:hypothetical protein